MVAWVSLLHFPTCDMCRADFQKLAHREYQLDQQSSEPIIVQFYNQMRDLQKEIRNLIPMHNKMLESLL